MLLHGPVTQLRMVDPACLPPILVHRDSMQVIDGVHRLKAARARGESTIATIFFDGDDDEAFICAVRANTTHGLPLTLDDRKAAAMRIIVSRPNLSDRIIGSFTGLADKTVAVIRRSSANGTQLIARIGADGRSRPLCGQEGRRRAAELITSSPQAPLRQIATAAGVSVGTAHDVRKRIQRGEDPVGIGPPPGNRQAAARRAADARVDSDLILRMLRGDPTLRNSDSGRSLLRWLHAHVAGIGEWRVHAEAVPPYRIDGLMLMAQQCAREWDGFAASLKQRKQW